MSFGGALLTEEELMQIAEMQDMSADEIVKNAGADFDAWCAAHAEEVETLDMLERIDLYAVDAAWHSRETAV